MPCQRHDVGAPPQSDLVAADVPPTGAEPDPQQSPTDVESLFGIASASNYLTRCPVMVIAGLDPETRRVAELGSWAFPLSGRIYRVEIEVIADDKGGAG